MVRKRNQRRKGKKKSGLLSSVRGTVTARKCKQCGHHEIGIITEEGGFLPLKPRMKVQLISERD